MFYAEAFIYIINVIRKISTSECNLPIGNIVT